MLQRYTDIQQAIIAALAHNRQIDMSWRLRSNGRYRFGNIQGQGPAAPRGYRWHFTGEKVVMTLRKGQHGNGKRPVEYWSPVYTLADLRVPKAVRMARRRAKGLPDVP
jgi:hypothetical protein